MILDGELQDLLARLVAIDSVNPDLVPGGAGEGLLGDFVGEWLASVGVEVTAQEAAPGRRNVIGRVRGTGSGASLMLNAHLDTVGTASMPGALEPTVREGRLYGRGAQDMKSGLAAAMLVLREAVGAALAGDLVLACVIDEEGDSKGTEALLATWTADAGIALEPTGHVVAPLHKGFVWAEIETTGVAAHGSDPVSGVDAIAAMGHVLVELERLGAEVRQRPPVAPVGSGSLHAGLISGGSEPCTYPERCRLVIERRTVPGETTPQVLAEFEGVLSAAGAGAAGTPWTAAVSLLQDRPPLSTPSDAGIVATTARSCERVLGSVELGGVAFWTDAALMSAAGIPSVVFGVRGGGLHSRSEWVELASLSAVTAVLADVVGHWCRPPR